ncbi:MAG: ACP S-malonyltransferase [Kiloniellales bacterium]|nr:ACP S-malonyltransferase [Kiloniellales bacterium]
MERVFVFPGQGSQSVGMGQALASGFPVAKHLFEEVDDALGQHLSRIMAEGPAETLTLTENAQPALMAVSLATVRVLESEGGFMLHEKARFVAGHSLGEYSALAAARAIEVSEAAKLLKLRGQAMQEAVPVGEGAMAALLGLEMEAVREIAESASDGEEICAPANDNAPGQIVVSGSKAAVERAVALAKEKGAKRALLLDVSAPFHCRLMAPAADRMADALAAVNLRSPNLPLVSNVEASAVNDPDRLRRLLVEQVTGMVRWRESVLFMREEGIEELVELGTGKVLSGLARRIDRDLSARNAGTPEEVEALLGQL